jgi:hypothetical protein
MATITVLPQGAAGRTAIWDRDPAYDDGDLFLVAGGPAVTVPVTPGVERAIREGRLLVLAPAPEVPAAEPAKAPRGKKAKTADQGTGEPPAETDPDDPDGQVPPVDDGAGTP